MKAQNGDFTHFKNDPSDTQQNNISKKFASLITRAAFVNSFLSFLLQNSIF
jgi:hypothetical protein